MKAIMCIGIMLLASLPIMGASVDFSRVDLDPFLRIHASRQFAAYPPDPFGLGSGAYDDVILVSRGGATVSVHTDLTSLAAYSLLVRGIGTSGELSKLKRILTSSRVGVQRPCALLGQGEAVETRGSYELTWYGQGRRRNNFTVILFGASEIPSLPLCSPEVARIIEAIGSYALSVERDPKSEVLNSFEQ